MAGTQALLRKVDRSLTVQEAKLDLILDHLGLEFDPADIAPPGPPPRNVLKGFDKAEEEGASEAEIDVSKSAAELAEEAGIDLAGIEGTGKDGKIIKPDVEKAIAEASE
jgi:pyruvate dehydrogenase E2 component (dihydrolipoamide acetyltransferase)